MENLIKDLEELTQRMPWGTVERGETGFYVNGLDVPCYMPYGIESIVRAISELKKYEELKKKISDGRLVELPPSVGEVAYFVVSKGEKDEYDGSVKITLYPLNTKAEQEVKLIELKNK